MLAKAIFMRINDTKLDYFNKNISFGMKTIKLMKYTHYGLKNNTCNQFLK